MEKIKSHSVYFAAFVLFLLAGWYLFSEVYVSNKNKVQNKLALSALQKLETNIIIFGTDWCPYCEQTKEYLNSRNVQYYWVDIEETAENSALFNRFDIDVIPLIITKDLFIEGFNKDELNKINN